jgi:hypothetical protein
MDKAERRRKLRQIRYEQKPEAKLRKDRYETASRSEEVREVYAASDSRKQSRVKYETGTAKITRANAARERYRNRPIVALDGEGVTIHGDHKYILLQSSTGKTLFNANGITTQEAFNWLVDLSEDYPNALFVSFGFGYDINKILKDLRPTMIKTLRRNEYLLVGDFRVWWRSNKFFGVGKETNTTVWDLRSFFRGSFIAACQEFLGGVPEVIATGKANRSGFKLEDLETIKEYNSKELELMVLLAERIRHKLDDLGIRLNRFDGSGSIAAAIMRAQQVKEHIPEPDELVKKLSAAAFIGGRIECIQYGHSTRGGYQYDMRAAYPWAMTQLPSFNGTWKHHATDPGQRPFTLYSVKWSGWSDPVLPAPLPFRTSSGAIVFPAKGRGLVWSPEVENLRGMGAETIHYEIVEAWEFVPNDTEMRPWSFMSDLYDKRQQLEADGNKGAASILKLGTNSIWGKLAQRVGHDDTKAPGFHHLAAAGLVTSIVRAEVYRLAMTDLENVIAIETDAVVTRTRLKNWKAISGPSMGQWKETRFGSLTYCNTGLAFAEMSDGTKIMRTAGIRRGDLSVEMVLDAGAAGARTVQVIREHFIGSAECEFTRSWKDFGQWKTITDQVSIRPTGKRIPLPMSGNEWKRWNPTICPVLPEVHSKSYQVPWELDQSELEEYLENTYKEDQALARTFED